LMAGGHHGSGKERGKRPPIDHGQLLALIGRPGEEKKEGEGAEPSGFRGVRRRPARARGRRKEGKG
jgi:hypothetical protein